MYLKRKHDFVNKLRRGKPDLEAIRSRAVHLLGVPIGDSAVGRRRGWVGAIPV